MNVRRSTHKGGMKLGRNRVFKSPNGTTTKFLHAQDRLDHIVRAVPNIPRSNQEVGDLVLAGPATGELVDTTSVSTRTFRRMGVDETNGVLLAAEGSSAVASFTIDANHALAFAQRLSVGAGGTISLEVMDSARQIAFTCRDTSILAIDYSDPSDLTVLSEVLLSDQHGSSFLHDWSTVVYDPSDQTIMLHYDGTNGLGIETYDYSDPSNPVRVFVPSGDEISVGSIVVPVAFNGGKVYMTDSQRDRYVEVSNPKGTDQAITDQFGPEDAVGVIDFARGLVVMHRLNVSPTFGDFLTVASTSLEGDPSIVGALATPDALGFLSYNADEMIATYHAADGLHFVDVSDGANPTEVALAEDYGGSGWFVETGDAPFVYVAKGDTVAVFAL